MGFLSNIFNRHDIEKMRDNDISAQFAQSDVNPFDVRSIAREIHKKKPNLSEREIVQKLIQPDDDLEHLTPDGELPWGWHTANREFTEKVLNKLRLLSDEHLKSKKAGVKQEYAALKIYLQYELDVIKLCEAKGECFAAWASWCVANQEEIDRNKARLLYLEENMEKLIKEEEERRYIETVVLPSLQKRLVEIIKESPGIIQSSIYKLFDADMKNHIQLLLYNMDRDDLIMREKSGRSYKLFLR